MKKDSSERLQSCLGHVSVEKDQTKASLCHDIFSKKYFQLHNDNYI